MKQVWFLALSVFTCFNLRAQQCPVIPLPREFHQTGKTFVFDSTLAIIYKQDSFYQSAKFLANELKDRFGLVLPVQKWGNGQRSIELSAIVARDESYQISMVRNEVMLNAGTKHGMFNAVISLLQVAGAGSVNGTAITLPCWQIMDRPAESWRGYMLDESRHFFGTAIVKKLLDQMAYYKLNVFHWHLTDEPGWRIEIKKYPLLTTIGARGNYADPMLPAAFYTQEDIRDIVAYASERYITVVPEIDMPGHASAANRSYPKYSGGGSAKHPEFTFNPGLEETYRFLGDILREVAGLFPSHMIHIGGDEVSFGNEKWATDSAILDLKKRKGLASSLDVEHYFIRRMADTIRALGCTMLGWDEIASIPLDPSNTIVCWWRHDRRDQLQMALEKGYRVVLCPRLPFYFDFVQTDRDKVGRRWGKSFVTLADTYRFDIDSLGLPKGLLDRQREKILGFQGALWTEQVRQTNQAWYLSFPRILALAEACWTLPERRNFDNFHSRFQADKKEWSKLQIYYYDDTNPEKTPEIANDGPGVQYYLDGKK